MSEAAEALTLVWKTLGIEDHPVEEVRTVTMRSGVRPLNTSTEELVQRLPRLLRKGDADTMPELRIKGTLGEGGMGLVELAEQLSLGRDVAVKRVRGESPSLSATLILLREGWTTGLLEHPNIVPVYTLGRNDDGEPVIVMKKISGTSWLEIIEDPGAAPEAFDAEDPLSLHVEVLTQVCNAIQFAHRQGVIHRDLKPENVMLGEFGEVYVLDWGIAVSIDDDPTGRLALAKEVTQPTGTPAYMAPEMVKGYGEELGTHTDIFLLGAILFEALTGEPPYSGKTLFAVMMNAHDCPEPTFDESVPPELAAICKKAMARDPEDRFESAWAFRDALHQYRRNREARRLARQGDDRRAEVVDLLDLERSGHPIEERALYKTFGECRFAYEQSLEISPSNASARDGLQLVLEGVTDRELNREAHKAASLLIADFPRPNPEFQQRLDELAEKLDARQEHYEELQQIRHDVDLEVGRHSRTLFASVMGIIWGVSSFSLAFAIEKSYFVLSYPRMMYHIVSLTTVVALATYLGRNHFFANEVNRRLILAILATFGCTTLGRFLGWKMELPILSTMTMEMLTYGTVSIILAVTVDKRVALAGVTFFAASLLSAIWPPLLFWFFATANVLGMGLMVWIWWPEEGEKAIC